MPKINKKSIKTFKTYPTLKIFKYENIRHTEKNWKYPQASH